MAGRLFELQSRNGILEEKDRRLYEYAYGVLLGRVVIYLIIVILGIITGNWMEMIVFLLPFTVLRQYAGGIHLEKAGGCMAVSGILVLLCSLYLASAPAVIWQMRIIWFVAVGILFELDIDKESNIGKFFKGSDLVIGAIGPSADYSEKMLLGAMAENIPYVDPGGIHLIRKMRNSSMKGTAIVGSGIFPGLSGWMLSSVLKEAFNDDLIEMIIGGVYNFSKAAAIDYVEEIKSYKAGIPMACVRNGKILPAQKRSPLNLPTRISKLSILPYVTEEIQEIIQGKYMLNIDSYTAAPVSLFSIVNKAHCQKKDLVNALMGQKNSNQKAFIWVRQNKGNDSRCIYFEGKNPSVLTGEILAITANAIFEMPRKDGIYTMASYLEKYQVLDELKKIDKFKSEGKI